MLNFLEPHETIVTAIPHRDDVVIVGDHGTIVLMRYDERDEIYFYERAHAGPPMTSILQPREMIVAAIPHRAHAVFFGDRGTVVLMRWDERDETYVYELA